MRVAPPLQNTKTDAAINGAIAMDHAILIAVPTYRRPIQLERLLNAIATLDVSFDVRVLVADNDAQGREGEAVVSRRRAEGYRFPLEAIVVEGKGLCFVRNALFAHALETDRFTHLAMIDDDEWPDRDWLSALVETQIKTGADVIAGPVVSVFDVDPPRWISQCLLFQPESRPEGLCDIVWGSNNVLVSRLRLEKTTSPWFDTTFNTTGGEDSDFFSRLKAEGCRFGWAPRARIWESVPIDRAQISWIMHRARRIGTTDVHIKLKRSRSVAERSAIMLKDCASLVVNTLLLPLLLPIPRQRADAIFHLTKSFGKIYGYYGGMVHEYR